MWTMWTVSYLHSGYHALQIKRPAVPELFYRNENVECTQLSNMQRDNRKRLGT
ncbi:hypothetical protein DPMN_042231 [Dreissena polymorpha]|uniref:Uncharacterized protein n=1 Tax=Dreissena polymorpha TaxID=45954 RepID=A0A9D4D0P8_DREPO|nr:hypothetical protein DPMN_042231 [Dreissena polymorpha]